MEPTPDKELLVPDILFVPLLTFNQNCHRLGYGGGFYDRTINHIKKVYEKEILTIGVAFDV
jgi:5-formyltetrahydrofolate cyclo-ligase